jgi:citronellol/citronellal dehydrogenase
MGITLKDKRILITGGSRGIGAAIALRAARDGAKVAIAAKSDTPHPTLPGTIYSVAEEIEAAGGQALPLKLDVRSEENIQAVVQAIQERWGGLDILVNNAGAISITNTADTTMKKFDLMFAVNVRATYACSKFCYPLLTQGDNPHILNLSPPLSLEAKWFAPHVAYTMSKYGMSMCTLGMSAEFAKAGVAVNSLWPISTIATAAIEVNFPHKMFEASRKPTIVADAAHAILCKDAKTFTGHFCIDEDILREIGVKDFDQYAVNKEVRLQQDLYLPARDDERDKEH